jgi:hypothetical protein
LGSNPPLYSPFPHLFFFFFLFHQLCNKQHTPLFLSQINLPPQDKFKEICCKSLVRGCKISSRGYVVSLLKEDIRWFWEIGDQCTKKKHKVCLEGCVTNPRRLWKVSLEGCMSSSLMMNVSSTYNTFWQTHWGNVWLVYQKWM